MFYSFASLCKPLTIKKIAKFFSSVIEFLNKIFHLLCVTNFAEYVFEVLHE